MALPSQGTITSDMIAAEVGASTGTTHKLAGESTPTTDAMIYWYRPGNVNTAGVDQNAPFNYSDFYGQEALYKCTAYVAGSLAGTATIVEYPGVSRNISVPPNTTYNYCTRINFDGTVAATSISNLTVTAGASCNANVALGNSTASAYPDFGINGVRLYSSFSTNGSGSFLEWLCNDVGGTYTGTFWANPNNNRDDGRLNQTGLWSGSYGYELAYVGTGSLSFGISVPTTKDYYVGIGGDNYLSIYLDNVLQVAQTLSTTSTDNFRFWHIYPINISAGLHTIRVTGINNPGSLGSNPGAMGVEIYDNTTTQISASIQSAPATGSIPADLNILYSSANYRGSGVIGAAFYNQGELCALVPPSPTPTSTPSVTRTPSVTPSVTPSITITPTVTPTVTPSITITPTRTPSITLTPTQTVSAAGYGYYTTSYDNSTDACRLSDLPNSNLYAIPGNTTPTVGMTLYTTEFPLSNPFNGQEKWWRLQRDATVWAVKINTLGQVMTAGVIDCSTIPSETPSRTPSVTPSVTPSITRTPSVTPSVTPSITITPTVTPTVTPSITITPTRTPSITLTPTQTVSAVGYGYYNVSYSNSTDACRLSSLPNANLYAIPGNTTPTVGMVLYTTEFPLSNPFNGQQLWWRLQRSSTVWAVKINTDGTVMAAGVVDCSTIPSETPSRTPSTTPSVTPSITLTPTVTPTVTPSITPSITITPTRTPSITLTPTQTVSAAGYGYVPISYNNSTDACRSEGSLSGNLYANPGNTTPTEGMIFYTTEFPLSNPFNGQQLWWKLVRNTTTWAVKINTDGTVMSAGVVDCSTIPSETPSRTPTPTPSVTPSSATFTYNFTVYQGTTGEDGTACCGTGTAYTVYSNDYSYLVDLARYYNSDGSVFNGGGNTFSDGFTYGTINSSGFFAYVGDCNCL